MGSLHGPALSAQLRIQDPEVLAGFARCLEDMPSRPLIEVKHMLEGLGWSEAVLGIEDAINAGTIAQVHALSLHELRLAIKVTFPDNLQRFQTDFRLFEHAKAILKALKLNDEKANIVSSMFDAVGKNEKSVLREFDLMHEARYCSFLMFSPT